MTFAAQEPLTVAAPGVPVVCKVVARKIAKQIFKGNEPDLYLEPVKTILLSPSEISKKLQKMGVDEAEADQFAVAVHAALNPEAKVMRGLAKHYVSLLEYVKNEKNQEDVTVCLASGDCEGPLGTAITLQSKFSFKTGRVVYGKAAEANAGTASESRTIRLTAEEQNSDVPTILLINLAAAGEGNAQERGRTRSLTVMHELSHKYQTKLISSWIDANVLLEARNQKADPIFRKYVTKIDGQYVIDEGFKRVFMEGLSVAAMADAGGLMSGTYGFDAAGITTFRSWNGPNFAQGMIRHMKEGGYGTAVTEAIAAFELDGAPFEVTGNNLIPTAIKIEAIMQSTIARKN